MVSIRLSLLERIHLCSGVLVSDIFVLTAARCFDRRLSFIRFFSIQAGIHSIYNESEATEQLRLIPQIIIHPNYTANKFLNNLALVRVSQSFNIESFSVSTISLSNLTSLEDMPLITVGWKFMANQSDSSLPSTFLQQMTVRENVQCTKNKSFDSKTQLCAIGEKYLNCIFFSMNSN